MLQRLILISIEDYSDSDVSLESEYESDQESTPESDCDTDENLEPELSETIYDEYENAPWNPEAQLQAQLNTARLAQLHADIKARAPLPDPTYQKLPQDWPTRPFDVRILPDYVQHPIHYFELFWGPEIWNILVENTNAYAQYKQAWRRCIGLFLKPQSGGGIHLALSSLYATGLIYWPLHA
jgi:hypothetical protein